MEFSSFNLVVTYDCNFNCQYCYQKGGKEYLDFSIVKRALEFFFPYFSSECYLVFYGGEPLLALDTIKRSVNLAKKLNNKYKKNIRFSITTNGSHLDKDVLEFFNDHRFLVLLSFDGLTQEIYRKEGSFESLSSVLKKISEYPGITWMTNSVFTCDTVEYTAESAQYIIELGVTDAELSFSTLPPWDDAALMKLKEQLSILREFLVAYYKEKKLIPVTIFRKSKDPNVFGCSAGLDRMALTPDGRIWGCCFFSDFYRDKPERKERLRYSFGYLNEFIENHERIYPKVLPRYNLLRMDHFNTTNELCMMCDYLKECAVCPIDAAQASSVIGLIPDWVCGINKTIYKEKKILSKEIENQT